MSLRWYLEFQEENRAYRGAYWLGMLGFALAAPAAIAWARLKVVWPWTTGAEIAGPTMNRCADAIMDHLGRGP